jgi:DNA polymerase-4
LFDPKEISFECDEALLEITQLIQTKNSYSVAQFLQKEVFERTGLIISIGIAHTSQLAKIGSDGKKANGNSLVPDDPNEFQQFLNELPIRKIPGVGGSIEQLLYGLEIRKLKDIIEKRSYLVTFPPKTTEFLFRSALGVPSSQEWSSNSNQKSISKESTFDTITNVMDLIDEAEKLAIKVHRNAKDKEFHLKQLLLNLNQPILLLLREVSLLTPTQRN